MKIIRIPPREVPSVYQSVVPDIQKALDRSMGEESIKSIYEDLLSNHKQLFFITDDDYKFKALAITRIAEYPNHKSLILGVLSGSGLMKFLSYGVECLKVLAKENSCKTIEIMGRKGWTRILERYGYKEFYRHLVLEVQNERILP